MEMGEEIPVENLFQIARSIGPQVYQFCLSMPACFSDFKIIISTAGNSQPEAGMAKSPKFDFISHMKITTVLCHTVYLTLWHAFFPTLFQLCDQTQKWQNSSIDNKNYIRMLFAM